MVDHPRQPAPISVVSAERNGEFAAVDDAVHGADDGEAELGVHGFAAELGIEEQVDFRVGKNALNLGKPLLKRPLERHFGWMGLLAIGLGLAIGATSLGFSLDGWSIERLWLHLLGAAMLVLVGLQMAVFWVVVQVLGELSQREAQVTRDLAGQPCRV